MTFQTIDASQKKSIEEYCVVDDVVDDDKDVDEVDEVDEVDDDNQLM